MKWLSRSIGGESLRPVAIESLVDKLDNEWISISKVRDMEAYKTFVTFALKEDMEVAFSSRKELLLDHFVEIRR